MHLRLSQLKALPAVKIMAGLLVLGGMGAYFCLYLIPQRLRQERIIRQSQDQIRQADLLLANEQYDAAQRIYQQAAHQRSLLGKVPGYLEIKLQVARYLQQIQRTICRGDYQAGRRLIVQARCHAWPEGLPPILAYRLPFFENLAGKVAAYQDKTIQVLKLLKCGQSAQGHKILQEMLKTEQELRRKGFQAQRFGVSAALLHELQGGDAFALMTLWQFHQAMEVNPGQIRQVLSHGDPPGPNLALLRRLLDQQGLKVATILNKIFPDSDLEHLAHSYLMASRTTSQTQQAVQIALKLAPGFSSAYLHRARVYRQTGDLAHALADYTKAYHCSMSSILGERGEIYLWQHAYAQAYHDFNQALQHNPENERANQGLGLLLLLFQRQRGAVRYLKKCQLTKWCRDLLLLAQGKSQQALQALTHRHNELQGPWQAYNALLCARLGLLLKQERQAQEWIRQTRQLLASYKLVAPEMLVLEAVQAHRAGHADEEQDKLTQLTALSKQQPLLAYFLGLYYQTVGAAAQAHPFFQRAQQACPALWADEAEKN